MRHTPIYTQQYRFVVSEEFAGLSIIDFFCRRFSFKPREYWISLMAAGDISLNNQGIGPDHVLKENDVVRTLRRDVREPDVNDEYEVICDRDGVLIINKPAPLPVHPAGRYYKNSLIHILKEKNPEQTYHTIHRLDTWTTGVLILATCPKVARCIHLQVEKKKIEKTYAVLAKGNFGDKKFIIDEPVGRVDGAHRGFGPGITEAKESVTEFTPMGQVGDVTLLKANPITGRTNQIRVHVQAAGGHIINDPLYSPNPVGKVSFIGLHCRSMAFKLSNDGEIEKFVAPWPKPFLEFFNDYDTKKTQDSNFAW